MSEILVSVVIPAYNQSAYIANAIESVLDQTFKKYEIIVVDDGSTDDTQYIAEKFSKNIRYIRQENQGLAGARNTGIRNAQSHLICLLDADDQWMPKYLERMMALAVEDPDAAVYYCCAQAIDEKGNKLPQVFGCHTKQNDEDLLNMLFRANFIIPSTVMMNYETIRSGEKFDLNFRRIQDRELWIRLLKQGYRFEGLSEVLVNYRIHNESLSVDVSGGQQAAIALVKKHFGNDDGQPELWDKQKRHAYGGAYRYHVLSSVKRQNNWRSGAYYLSKALITDPSLASDLELFYELTLGTQPEGFRGSTERISVKENADALIKLLDEVFQSNNLSLKSLNRLAYSTACYAIGMCAYNVGQLNLARSFLWRAGGYRSQLWYSSSLPGLLVKSLLGERLLNHLRLSR